jgi:hypothetical protein
VITVVCWKWRPHGKYRSTFGPATVNVLRRMVARNLHVPHEFVCVTDDPAGIDPEVRIVPLWDHHHDRINPAGTGRPSCYARLYAFSREARDVLGDRILSIDLDCVVTGDLTPLVERDEDVVLYGDTHPHTPYNGGLWLLRTGTRTEVWERFDRDPDGEVARARALRYHGSDQAIMSSILGPSEARYSTRDGVYSFRVHLIGDRVYRSAPKDLPEGSCLVLFNGKWDPWKFQVRRMCPWVREHYR